jgi:acyl phosphate:glycerol-3-phosphate acyltransferase
MMMNHWTILLIAAITGYLIGSFSFARFVFARRKPGSEPDRIRTPTTDGQAELVSHAVGSTNVMIAFGPRWGMLTTAVDLLKAFAPTLLFHFLFPEGYYDLLCAVGILTGHLWPVWYSFRGGGGNACILGMLLAISPVGLIVTHATGMLIGRFFPMVAFLGGVVLTIPWFAWRNGILSPETVFALTITLLYIAGQLPEAFQIRRLKREGHVLDIGHVMRLMKKSAATGESGAKIMADATSHRSDSGKDPEDL